MWDGISVWNSFEVFHVKPTVHEGKTDGNMLCEPPRSQFMFMAETLLPPAGKLWYHTVNTIWINAEANWENRFCGCDINLFTRSHYRDLQRLKSNLISKRCPLKLIKIKNKKGCVCVCVEYSSQFVMNHVLSSLDRTEMMWDLFYYEHAVKFFKDLI